MDWLLSAGASVADVQPCSKRVQLHCRSVYNSEPSSRIHRNSLISAISQHPGLTSFAHIAVWCIAALAVLGVITRPRNLPEALWAVLAALALMLFGLISVVDVGKAVLRGVDVYLFLIGMMVSGGVE